MNNNYHCLPAICMNKFTRAIRLVSIIHYHSDKGTFFTFKTNVSVFRFFRFLISTLRFQPLVGPIDLHDTKWLIKKSKFILKVYAWAIRNIVIFLMHILIIFIYKVNVLDITNASTYIITKGKRIGYISFNIGFLKSIDLFI